MSTESSNKMPAVSANRVHQGTVLLSGFFAACTALYSLFDTSYYWGTSGSGRYSMSHIMQCIFLFCFGSVMLCLSILNFRMPLKWLSLLSSYAGSGAFLFYIGFIMLPLAKDFGYFAGVFSIVTGVLSIAFGLMKPEEKLGSYTALLNTKFNSSGNDDEDSHVPVATPTGCSIA